MRVISPAAEAAHAADAVGIVVFVEMYLTQTLRLASSSVDIVWNGNTYYGSGHLGAIEPIKDSPGEYKNLVFSLSAADQSLVSIALQEPIRGKTVHVRQATIDASTLEVLSVMLMWSGSLDQMPIEINSDTAVINVTAEHRGATFARPKPLAYTDDDQRRLFPGDTSLKTIQSQGVAPPRVWPSASYYRR